MTTNEATSILSVMAQCDPKPTERLVSLVYDELRQLAAQKLAQRNPGQTLQAIALVHEARQQDMQRKRDGRHRLR